MAAHSSNLAWEIPWMRNKVDCSPWGRRRVRHNLATERQPSMVNEQVAFLFKNQSSVSSICSNQHPPPPLPPSFPSQLPTTTTALPNPSTAWSFINARAGLPTPPKVPPAPSSQLSLIAHHASKPLFRAVYSLIQRKWQPTPGFLAGKSWGQNSLGGL